MTIIILIFYTNVPFIELHLLFGIFIRVHNSER